ncbi:MAG: preprotein translocase subunit SecG [Alphaproteobacteria bacterium]|nr:preprotein translocase subunit SecG [Alphaproteobacteria bacterium]
MITFLLVVHIIIAIGLVFFILMQHSEGGASGFVSGQMGNVMSIRGTANFMTKTTAILATLFFLSSIGLAMYSKSASKPKSIADSFKTHAPEAKKEDAKPQVPVAPIAGQAPKAVTPPLDTPKVEEKAPATTPVQVPSSTEAPKTEASKTEATSTAQPEASAPTSNVAQPAEVPVAPQENNEAPKN